MGPQDCAIGERLVDRRIVHVPGALTQRPFCNGRILALRADIQWTTSSGVLNGVPHKRWLHILHRAMSRLFIER
jgi:hypothetical protein